MSGPGHRRHAVLIGVWAVGQILLAFAMGVSHRDWLPWLEQGPLGIWLNGNSLLLTSFMMGFAAIVGRREESWRGLAISCLAALLVGMQWALGMLGGAILASHWIPEPENAFHVLLPILGGALCCAPLVVGPILSLARRSKRATTSPPVDEAMDSLQREQGGA